MSAPLAYWMLKPDRPVLAAHLPRRQDAAEAEFDRRVKARFPVGSLATELEGAVVADGFGPVRTFKRMRYVRLERSTGLLLLESLTITWEAENGKLTAIRGSYGLTGP